jgi:hypothetical protein
LVFVVLIKNVLGKLASLNLRKDGRDGLEKMDIWGETRARPMVVVSTW